MNAPTRQKHRITGLKRMDNPAIGAQVNPPARDEMELCARRIIAKSHAKGRGNLDAVVMQPVKPHAEQKLADQVTGKHLHVINSGIFRTIDQ